MAASEGKQQQVQMAVDHGDLQRARSIVFHWLKDWSESLSAHPSIQDLRQPELWRSLADVVERTHDHYLLELFWQILDNLPPPIPTTDHLPLLGVPILNGVELLERLLTSLDHPIDTLAIVDNSMETGSTGAISERLNALKQLGHPLIRQIRIARPFTNLGVAASWNLILSSFPQAPIALLANHDVVFRPGVLTQALAQIDTSRPQYLALLPPPNSFSAFLLTALAWNRLGLFDPGFHPAYFEDLDYRDRLRSDLNIEQIDGSFAHPAMTEANPNHSATIKHDPSLYAQNQASFQLNRLWYMSHRRIRHDPRGTWRRLWLSQWQPQPTDKAT